MVIKPGPVVEAFAKKFEIEIAEVCDWMNDYIGNPANWQQLGESYEADEAARVGAIKKYVSDCVKGNLN